MSNLRINIRILYWHFQVTTDWEASIWYNSAHKNLDKGLFEIYEFRLWGE